MSMFFFSFSLECIYIYLQRDQFSAPVTLISSHCDHFWHSFMELLMDEVSGRFPTCFFYYYYYFYENHLESRFIRNRQILLSCHVNFKWIYYITLPPYRRWQQFLETLFLASDSLKSCHWNSTLTLPQSPKKVSSPPTFGITILSVAKAPVFSGSSVTGESLWESEWMFIPSDWSVWQPTCACFYLFLFWRLAWTCPLVLQTCLWVQPGMVFFSAVCGGQR